ncbi:MAG: TetR/AcrR family transcriptional regulator [Clostridia bacterium]|jgi:AcrR family transcriptional regulator|nr:TetR/AcrR family transcriptional regulator [Clostridia bacterium]MCI2014326.1 TetR/AcrR family transcriptional regulator [Clostridia bacterium]
MSTKKLNTLERIHKAAKGEFLEKGFQAASLRNIVKKAGVTTGAFYGYYNSKEELFDALVEEPARHFFDEYKKVHDNFKTLSPEDQEQNMNNISSKWMIDMVDYLYDNIDAFKLLLTCAEGTKYANFVHKMVEIEVEATHDFTSLMQSKGKDIHLADPNLEHVLVSGIFASYFEMIIHEMPREQAKNYVKQLWEFQTAGLSKIMGI